MALRLAHGLAPSDAWSSTTSRPSRSRSWSPPAPGPPASVSELAGQVDVLCVMVRDDDQVREVLGEALGTARAGLVVVVHSTVAPQTPRQLQVTASRHDVLVVDAPVSGGAMGAADGSLAIMVGGSDAAYAAALPVLERMGTRVVHAGPIGAGTQMKLARNMMHFVAFTAATEAQRLAEAAGLDLVELGPRRPAHRRDHRRAGGDHAPGHHGPLAEDDFWFGVFDHVRALGEKDLAFAIELADTLGVDVPLAREARERLAKGLGLP